MVSLITYNQKNKSVLSWLVSCPEVEYLDKVPEATSSNISCFEMESAGESTTRPTESPRCERHWLPKIATIGTIAIRGDLQRKKRTFLGLKGSLQGRVVFIVEYLRDDIEGNNAYKVLSKIGEHTNIIKLLDDYISEDKKYLYLMFEKTYLSLKTYLVGMNSVYFYECSEKFLKMLKQLLTAYEWVHRFGFGKFKIIFVWVVD